MSTAARILPQTKEQRSDLADLGLWLLVLAVAGLVGTVSPLAGAFVDGMILVWLSIFARSRLRWADAAEALALVPLLRLLWLVMPIEGIPALDWTPLIALPFLAAALLAGRAVGLTPGDIRLRMPVGMVLSALVIGGWALAGVLLAVVAGDAVAWGTTPSGVAWVQVVVYALLIAIAEEVAFRGVLPAVLERAVPGMGIWVATAACAILCLAAGSPWWVAIALAIAGVNAVVAVRTRSLLPVVAGHALFLLALNL